MYLLSTYLLRGATMGELRYDSFKIYFYPRTSCEVRLFIWDLDRLAMTNFYPRTSCEVRLPTSASRLYSTKFLSTHLLRGATRLSGCVICLIWFLSTHLLRGATLLTISNLEVILYFYPRTSCEVRLISTSNSASKLYFYPRTSCEVRPKTPFDTVKAALISIHAPLARCDYSRQWAVRCVHISIHAPLARCDDAYRVQH